MGLGVLGVALARLGEQRRAVARRPRFGVALLAGGAIVYSFWLILATLSFWFVRVENILVIFQSMYEAGRWPVSIYPGWLRFGLTFLVPVAFAITVPAEALTGRLDGGTLRRPLLAWRWPARRSHAGSGYVGLKQYSGASA